MEEGKLNRGEFRLVDIKEESWGNSPKTIENFEDFLNSIIEWGGYNDDYPLYNIYILTNTFCNCIDYIEKYFSENEIQKTIDLLKPKELDYFLEMVQDIEHYILNPEEEDEDIPTSPVYKPKREYTPINPSNPFQSISSYDDFMALIDNWDIIIKDNAEFKVNGMIQIFDACLKHMSQNFFDFDLEQLSEALYDNRLNLLLKLREIAKQKASSLKDGS